MVKSCTCNLPPANFWLVLFRLVLLFIAITMEVCLLLLTLFYSASRLQPSSVVAFRNFEEESRRPVVWESNQNAASTTNGSRDNLASLYRPPFALMYNGPFDKVYVYFIIILFLSML